MKISSGITFPSATGTYVTATRTLAGLNTTPALSIDEATYKRLVIFFTAAGASYWGFIHSWVTPATMTLEPGDGLPSTNISVSALMVLDVYDSLHSYQNFLDEVASLVQDDAGTLSVDDSKAILTKAVTDWGKDQPLTIKKQVTGTGSNSYVLNTILSGLWKYGYSKIFNIEYPQGDFPPSFLEDDEWDIYDDGNAQDGSNLQLVFMSTQPATTETFAVEFNIEPLLPAVGSQNFPDTNFNFSCITLLAASYACDRLAAAYAQSTDATIGADVVNYQDKSSKYITLAKEYRKRYRILLFGSEEAGPDIKAAIAQKELTPSMSAETGGGSYLFHRTRR